MPEQVIIEFVSDTSQLQPAEDKLTALGKIDQQSATIFKQTNDQIKQRNSLLQNTVTTTEAAGDAAASQQAIYNKLAASVQKLSGASKEAVQSLLKMSAADVAKGFQEAAVDVDDYVAALVGVEEQQKNVSKSSTTVRAELKQLISQLSVLSASGQTNTEEFEQLALRAGKLQSVINDTNKTVGNLSQTFPTLKLFSTGLQTAVGAFTALTGAEALFGDENKDIQAVLVKVNSVMAINAGLSELLNTLNDEGTISTAKAIVTQQLKNAQTAISNGLEAESVVVRTAATIAQYALNLAMSLNPIGLLVIAIAAFVTGIVLYTKHTREAAEATTELNSAFAQSDKLLDAYTSGIDNANKKIISGLEARNARQSEIQEQELRGLKQNNDARLLEIARLNATIEKYQNSSDAQVQEDVKKNREQLGKIEDAYQAGRIDITIATNARLKQLAIESLEDQASILEGRLSLAAKNSSKEFALQRQLAVAKSAIDIQAAGDDAQKVFAIRSALSRQIKDIDIAQAAVAQKQIVAAQDSALIDAQNKSRAINARVSQEEIDIQKTSLIQRAKTASEQEGVLQNERIALIKKAEQDVLELQRNFDKQAVQFAIEDEISRNNAVLSQVKISEQDKLNLRISNIILAAAAEIEQNKGKISKIKEIEARRDADIKAARLQSIRDTLAQELNLQAAQEAGTLRNIERQLAAQDQISGAQGLNGDKLAQRQLNIQKLTLDQQKALIDQLTQYRLESDQKQIDANQKAFDQGLISEKEYNLSATQLIDQAAKDYEDGEARKRAATKKTADLAKQRTQEIVKDAIDGASQGISVLQSLYQQDSQAALDRIAAQQQGIQDLQAAGEISAKEASARTKKLDAEQKQLQTQQAKRQKELDLFQAVLNTALAVTNALTSGDPYTAPIRAAIAGAIGAAQIALIASRPIPQFGKGKKGNYTGLAEVGETGPEFVSRGGKMEYVDKATVTWLGASDKVYNPKETAAMIEARVPTGYYPGNESSGTRSMEFDYDKMGKAVGEYIPQTGIGFDELGLYHWTQSKQNFTKMLADRRRWKK